MNELMQSGYISILSDRCDQLRKEKEELQQRIDKAIKHIRKKTKIIPFDETGEGGGAELCDYDLNDLIRILEGSKENE
jgi:hypothetical protein